MFTIEIQALSVNIVSTSMKREYKQYIAGQLGLLDLPNIQPKEQFFLFIEFGIPTRQDCSNGIKVFEDCICNHLGINDRNMMALFVRKVIVPKSNTYIKFNIFEYEYDLIQAINQE